jgi:hypothetical protein
MKIRPARRQSSDDAPTSDREPRFAKSSLIFLGLIVGLGLALYYAWVVEPVVYVKASPSRFADKFKEEYIYLVSQSYAADDNWELAQDRLAALDDPNIRDTVEQQLEGHLRSGESAPIMRNMALLAKQLGADSVAIGIFVPEAAETRTPAPSVSPTPVRTRAPTQTIIPTITPTSEPTPTPIPKYRLLSQEQVCDPNWPAPRVEVIVLDANLEPAPGVEVIVQWSEGTDHFFTGFQLDKGAEYGDFAMEPDFVYQVLLAEGSPIIDDLRIEECGLAQGGWPGGWRLTFQNTDVPQEDPDSSGN